MGPFATSRASLLFLMIFPWLTTSHPSPYPPYFKPASYIRMTFSVGVSSWIKWVGDRQYPPPGFMISSVFFTIASVSSGVPVSSGPVVDIMP